MNYLGSPACGAAAAALMVDGWMNVSTLAERMGETTVAVRGWCSSACKKYWMVAQLIDGEKRYHITDTGTRVTNKLLCPSLKTK